MGFWRDIGSSLGVCEEKPRVEREQDEREYASRLNRHERGCTCHWCSCAKLGTPK